ncbi:hypothetical protein [Amycolatopsis sp. lyj-112]|uniref:hypothetical protein n=1 Tax=Amycolatopsis sp. lyj-112 TaxID=2789288 RepID=UPI00397A8B68
MKTGAAVRRVGVLVFGPASVAGQLAGAVVLNARTPGRLPSFVTFTGVAITRSQQAHALVCVSASPQAVVSSVSPVGEAGMRPERRSAR